MPDEARTVRHRVLSVRAALKGLAHAARNEVNVQIELAAAVLAVGLAVLLGSAGVGLSMLEWAVLVLTVVAVLTLELVNTAFEHLADLTRPRLDPLVRVAKDVSAGAVLLASLGAIAVGVLLFAPKVAQVLD